MFSAPTSQPSFLRAPRAQTKQPPPPPTPWVRCCSQVLLPRPYRPTRRGGYVVSSPLAGVAGRAAVAVACAKVVRFADEILRDPGPMSHRARLDGQRATEASGRVPLLARRDGQHALILRSWRCTVTRRDTATCTPHDVAAGRGGTRQEKRREVSEVRHGRRGCQVPAGAGAAQRGRCCAYTAVPASSSRFHSSRQSAGGWLAGTWDFTHLTS
jgi:hypothetical protein